MRFLHVSIQFIFFVIFSIFLYIFKTSFWEEDSRIAQTAKGVHGKANKDIEPEVAHLGRENKKDPIDKKTIYNTKTCISLQERTMTWSLNTVKHQIIADS